MIFRKKITRLNELKVYNKKFEKAYDKPFLGLIEQVNLNPYYKSTFHLNVDYNFDEKKWTWSSNDEVDDILWARDDKWFYPIDRVSKSFFIILFLPLQNLPLSLHTHLQCGSA